MIGSTAITMNFSSSWTREENKIFEQLLVQFPEELQDRWLRIAEKLPGKSLEMVREHYDALIHDVYEIDAGRVNLPTYTEYSPTWDDDSNAENQISFAKRSNRNDLDRRKGTPWTTEEHNLFLLGLNEYGQGDWRSISRNFVLTRTSTQVASHAQKYFNRQKADPKERKRSSIHDITAPSVPRQRYSINNHNYDN